MTAPLSIARHHCRRRSSAGFTLMEMILVLAIISMLVGLGAFTMKNVLSDADVDKARAARASGICWENESFLREDASMLDKAMVAYDETIKLGGESYIAYLAMVDKARLLAANAETRPEAVTLLERVVEERQKMADEVSTKSAEEIEAMLPVDRPHARITLVQFAKERLEAVKAQVAD